MSSPHYDLNKIIASSENCPFPMSDKSSRAVMAVYRILKGSSKSEADAQRFIKDELKKLEVVDFCGHTQVFQSEIADVYGKNIDGEPWYIKIQLDEDGDVYLLSFHPPEWEMKLQSGVVIKEGGLIYDKEIKMWKLR